MEGQLQPSPPSYCFENLTLQEIARITRARYAVSHRLRQREKIKCSVCGKLATRGNIARHQRTARCLDFIAKSVLSD